jgi:hypothetical protein
VSAPVGTVEKAPVGAILAASVETLGAFSRGQIGFGHGAS